MYRRNGRGISRKEFLKLLGGGALLPVLGGARTAPAAREADPIPNVILIVSDDHAPGEIGLLNPLLKTPNLDRLARSGVRFSHAFVNTSICAPGRACILTGLYSRQNGVVDNDLNMRRSDSLVRHLRKAGYSTGFAGKWHWPLFPDISEFGFDWRGAMVPGPSLHAHPVFAYSGQDSKPARVTKVEGDRAVTDAAISFLEANRDQGFFLWIAYFTAHVPMLMPQRFQAMYDPKDIALPANYVSERERPVLRAATIPSVSYGSPARDPEEIRTAIALYRGMVSYMDEQIGRLLESVKKLGLSRKTLIIFVGDNGYMLGNHGYEGKGLLYEESIKVPLIFTWPGRIKPRVAAELVCQMDILPTVMEMAKIPLPERLAGKSLLPLLQGKDRRLRDEVFCEFYPGKWKAVRTREWKYISTPELGEELYHLADAPLEMRNLAGQPVHRAVLEKLREDWSRWEKQIGEPKASTSGLLFADRRSGSGPNEEEAAYAELVKRQRAGFLRLFEENDYAPQLLLDVGGWAASAWMGVLAAEGKLSPALNTLAERLKRTTYAQQVNSNGVRAVMSEFLRELAKSESRPAC